LKGKVYEITGAVASVSSDGLQKVFQLVYVLGSMLQDKWGSLTAVLTEYVKFVSPF
jgi:hypothetical protein